MAKKPNKKNDHVKRTRLKEKETQQNPIREEEIQKLNPPPYTEKADGEVADEQEMSTHYQPTVKEAAYD